MNAWPYCQIVEDTTPIDLGIVDGQFSDWKIPLLVWTTKRWESSRNLRNIQRNWQNGL